MNEKTSMVTPEAFVGWVFIAALEHMVKTKVDRVAPGSYISQSITAVTRIGRPGAGNRAMLV